MIWVLTGVYIAAMIALVLIARYMLPRGYREMRNNHTPNWLVITQVFTWCGVIALIFFLITWLYFTEAFKTIFPTL